jgi:tetratricopeptide (TPR) repeat protein
MAAHPDPKYRNGKEAIALATQAVTLTQSNDVEALDTLAAAYAEEGDFSTAVSIAKKAIGAVDPDKDDHLAAEIGKRLKLYERGEAFHQPTW